MRYAYPLDLERDEDGRVVVHIPDLPGAHTDGADEGEALAEAEDCLIAALIGCMRAQEPIPAPSPARGRPTVIAPPLVAAKLALYEAMREAGVSEGALAERLGVSEAVVRRLLDLDHRSHIGQVDAALRALGKRLAIEVRDAA
jgi:antitoxin HicB